MIAIDYRVRIRCGATGCTRTHASTHAMDDGLNAALDAARDAARAAGWSVNLDESARSHRCPTHRKDRPS